MPHLPSSHGGLSVTLSASETVPSGQGVGGAILVWSSRWPSLPHQRDLTSVPSGMGATSFCPPPKKKKKSRQKIYFFHQPQVPGLTYVTYITVISCVRTAQRVSGKAKDASLDCGPLKFRHGQRSEEGCVGVRNVSDSSLRPCPVPQPGNSARRHCKRGFETKTERQACFLGPLDPQTL